jgi:hypothetical protein
MPRSQNRPIFANDFDALLANHDALRGLLNDQGVQFRRNGPDSGGDRFTLTPQFAGGALSRKPEQGKVLPFLGAFCDAGPTANDA